MQQKISQTILNNKKTHLKSFLSDHFDSLFVYSHDTVLVKICK